MFTCPRCSGPYFGSIFRDGEVVAIACHCRADGTQMSDWFWIDGELTYYLDRPKSPPCGWVGPALSEGSVRIKRWV